MSNKIHNKIKKYLKSEYDYIGIEDKDLSLYGFTNIHLIDDIPVATLNLSGNLSKHCFYRILDKVHYHHLEKLNRLREKLNDRDYMTKMRNDKRTERVKSWFRKVHTEVYQRGRL